MTQLLVWQGGHGWGGGPWFGLVWLAIWAFVIVGGIYLLRRRGGTFARTEPGAEAELAARYARGDITEDEYRERLAVLRDTKR